MLTIGLTLSAFTISSLLVFYLKKPGTLLSSIGHLTKRESYGYLIPHTGGIAILSSIFLCTGFFLVWFSGEATESFAWLATGAFLIVILALIDDKIHLPPAYRLIVHFVAAGLIIKGGFILHSFTLFGIEITLTGTMEILATLLTLVWMLNLYNFMDGIDGLAGGMAVIGFGTYAFIGWLAQDQTFMLVNLIVTASAGGFLLFNFPPARIFMGDVGSSLLGLLAATFALWANQDGLIPLWISALIFSPFIVDATLTLLRRVIKRENFWLPHKTHYYQRLVAIGWGHRKTVLWEYALMLLCSIMAIIALSATVRQQMLIVGFMIILYISFISLISSLEGRNSAINHKAQSE